MPSAQLPADATCSSYVTSLYCFWSVVTLRGVGSVPDRETSAGPLAPNKPLGAYIMFSHQCKSEHVSEWISKLPSGHWLEKSEGFSWDFAAHITHRQVTTEGEQCEVETRTPNYQLTVTCIRIVFWISGEEEVWRYPKPGSGLVCNWILSFKIFH